ncbi:MAG: ROK family protein [Actinomycetota bacterium]
MSDDRPGAPDESGVDAAGDAADDPDSRRTDAAAADDPSEPDDRDSEPVGDEPQAEDVERRPGQDVVMAIDIGGTKFAAGLVTARGELIDRARVEVPRDALPEQHWDNLLGICRHQIERARTRHNARVRAIGVGSAGPVARNVETVSPLNIAAWRDFPLRKRLDDTFARPVFGDLDAKALALAEGWLGAAQGHANFCALTVSTGVGGGVILDGELLDGNTGNAGHIGHVIVEPGGRRCECGARGCLEAEASGLAIEAITGRPPTEPTYEIMQRTGRLVGRAAATVCNALDLSLVVVGGSVALGFAATFFHSAQLELDEHARTSYSRGARITPSRLGDSGPLIGAGAVGWRGLRRSRRRSGRSGGPRSGNMAS